MDLEIVDDPGAAHFCLLTYSKMTSSFRAQVPLF